MVIFRTQLEVNHDNADLAAGYYQNDKDKEEESKKVIELILVHSRENEEEFDKASSKWQNSSHQGAENRIHVPDLCGHLSGDLVGSHWLIVALFSVAKKVSNVDQGQGNTKPHGSHS